MSLIALNVVLGSANRETPPETRGRGSGDAEVFGSWLGLNLKPHERSPDVRESNYFLWSYSKCEGLVSPV